MFGEGEETGVKFTQESIVAELVACSPATDRAFFLLRLKYEELSRNYLTPAFYDMQTE